MLPLAGALNPPEWWLTCLWPCTCVEAVDGWLPRGAGNPADENLTQLGQLPCQLLYSVVSLRYKTFFLVLLLLLLFNHCNRWIKEYIYIYMQLPFRISADQDPCHLLVVLSRVMCELPAELKTKQTTCLYKDLSSCSLLPFYFLLSFCASAMLCIVVLCFYGCWACFLRDTMRQQRN